jgi:hypothetical protein
MKERKKTKKLIKYCSQLITDEATGYLLPEYSHSNIVMSATKRYHNCLYLLAKLNNCSRSLIDWLSEQMDIDNIIYSNAVVRQKYIDYILKITSGDIKYVDITVKKAFKTLSERGLILKQQRGVFQVNPEYFFIGTEKERENKIVLRLEFEKGVNTKLIIEKYRKEEIIDTENNTKITICS